MLGLLCFILPLILDGAPAWSKGSSWWRHGVTQRWATRGSRSRPRALSQPLGSSREPRPLGGEAAWQEPPPEAARSHADLVADLAAPGGPPGIFHGMLPSVFAPNTLAMLRLYAAEARPLLRPHPLAQARAAWVKMHPLTVAQLATSSVSGHDFGLSLLPLSSTHRVAAAASRPLRSAGET